MKTSTMDCISKFLAELIGTAMLVFLGCTGSTHNNSIENSTFQSSFNYGLVVTTIVQCFGCVCGAHLSPAITLSVYVYGMISLTMTFAYFAAQFLGAYLGYGLMLFLVPPSAVSLNGAAHKVCLPTPHPEITEMQAFWIEFIITAMIIFTTGSVADPRNAAYQDSLPIRFGIVIACMGLSVGQLTGANSNPAKALSISAWTSEYEYLWLYLSAPMISAAISSIFYKLVFRREYVDTTEVEKIGTSKS